MDRGATVMRNVEIPAGILVGIPQLAGRIARKKCAVPRPARSPRHAGGAGHRPLKKEEIYTYVYIYIIMHVDC